MKLQYLARIKAGLLVPISSAIAAVAVGLAKFKDEPVRVTVEVIGKTRSLKQNSRYWTLIVPSFSEWVGSEQFAQSAEESGITPKDSAHNVLKALFVGRQKVTLPNGQVVEVEPSTRSLTVAQFAELQDKAERLLNANGIWLPAEE